MSVLWNHEGDETMNWFCDCIDDKLLIGVPEELYQSANRGPDEWICLDCLAATKYFWLPTLVDDLGINSEDLVAPEKQEDSE